MTKKNDKIFFYNAKRNNWDELENTFLTNDICNGSPKPRFIIECKGSLLKTKTMLQSSKLKVLAVMFSPCIYQTNVVLRASIAL